MTTDLAVVEQQPNHGLSLSDGPNPAQAVAYAAQVSTQIASVLSEGNGYSTIQGKKHVTIEGWQSLAAMTGHSVEVEWSRPVEGMPANDKGVMVWEARAIVRDQSGRVVASGEAMADPAERAPWGRANFSVRSMCQTRAMSRALSSRMRYIVQLAGFSGTPAEEMGGEPAEPVQRQQAPSYQERQAEAERRVIALGVTDIPGFFTGLGVDHPRKLANAATWRKVDAELTKREQEAAEAVEGEVVEEPSGDEALADQLFAETATHEDPS